MSQLNIPSSLTPECSSIRFKYTATDVIHVLFNSPLKPVFFISLDATNMTLIVQVVDFNVTSPCDFVIGFQSFREIGCRNSMNRRLYNEDLSSLLPQFLLPDPLSSESVTLLYSLRYPKRTHLTHIRLLWKTTLAQPLKNFLTLQGIQRFIRILR